MAHKFKRWSEYCPIEEQKLMMEGWDIVARAEHLTDLPPLPKRQPRKVIKVNVKGVGKMYSLFTKWD